MTPPDTSSNIGEVGYKLSLLRVAPGLEDFVARKHEAAIRHYSGSAPVCTLKLFGRFDLCTIYRTCNYGGGPSKAGPIPGIRGGNTILAFHWKSPREGNSLAVEESGGNVWGLLFFRFNESLARSFGVGIERALVEHWHENKPKRIELDIFGTAGWAELVFVLRGERFKDVISALSLISQQTVLVTSEQRTQKILVPAKTFSLLGVDFKLTRNPSALPRRFPENFGSGRGIFPVLNLTCPPGSMKKVHDHATRRFGRGYVTFGASDLVFTRIKGKWGTFIRDILRLRRGLSGHLYSTSVGIRVAGDLGFGRKSSGRLPESNPLSVSAARAKLFEKWGANFESRLWNLYFGLSNLMQDPLIGDCFSDMRFFVGSCLPLMLKRFPPETEGTSKLVDSVIDVATYGVEERAHGAFLAIEHLEASLSPTKGGIQRILKAASLIPKKLLLRAKKRWNGFLVAGYQNAFFASYYEIINLPFAHLFQPEEWCGLFHETGHAAFFDANFFNLDSPEITDVLIQAAYPAEESSLEFKRYKNLLFEVSADLFDLYFCYGDDVESYLSNLWPYILKDGRVLKTDYFIRYFIAFEYWKHLLQGRRSKFSSVEISRDIIQFRAMLRQLPPSRRTQFQSGAENEARVIFLALRPAIEMIHARFRQVRAPRDLGRELASSELRTAVDTVVKGKVWFKPIEAPDTFIIALKRRQKELTLASRLAAIMTLWHSATVGPRN